MLKRDLCFFKYGYADYVDQHETIDHWLYAWIDVLGDDRIDLGLDVLTFLGGNVLQEPQAIGNERGCYEGDGHIAEDRRHVTRPPECPSAVNLAVGDAEERLDQEGRADAHV